MSEDNSDIFSEYVENKGESEKTEDPTPIKVLKETGFLEAPLGEILLEIYTTGEMSLEDIADELDMSKTKAKRHLGELRLEGYLGVEFQDNNKIFYVRSRWETEEFPSGPVIPLVYQYNLLSDSQRLTAIKQAIDNQVNSGDIVADLGAGVGVLSYLAAKEAKKVYAVEMDREVFEKGSQIMEKESINNVEFIRDDARTVELPEEVDIIICEMLDTGLIAELQVPVMNHAISELSKENTEFIPCEAKTTATLIKSDYDFYDAEFRLPHFEEYGSRPSDERSEAVEYHKVNFNEKNSNLVEKQITIEANQDGLINGLQLNTDVKFGKDGEFIGASPWLDAPLNLPFESDYQLNSGDEITIELSYQLGGGLSNITYEVVGINE